MAGVLENSHECDVTDGEGVYSQIFNSGQGIENRGRGLTEDMKHVEKSMHIVFELLNITPFPICGPWELQPP